MSQNIDLTKGRVCFYCKQYKSREFFYTHPRGLNGLGSRCKECYSEQGTALTQNQRKKEIYNERKLLGLCVKCGEDSLKENVFCEDCWFLDRASARLGSSARAIDLKNIWKNQNGKCFYTGKELVPGVNASIDHQMPRSKGGSNAIDNLRWVTNEINMIKSSLTHKEFIEFCAEISAKFSQ